MLLGLMGGTVGRGRKAVMEEGVLEQLFLILFLQLHDSVKAAIQGFGFLQ